MPSRAVWLLPPLSLPLAAAARGGPVVTIPGVGAVAGVSQGGVLSFTGVPYAAPPVGDRRWLPPVAHPKWGGTRAADKFGAGCMASRCPGATSEDCLFLNVFAPADPAPGPLPVMFWIHGGAYMTGCSNLYNGSGLVTLANRSVIVVTINYRLNVFGFAGSAELATPAGGTGNYGIQDQRMALQWVHDNIAAFGGDSSQVTIFGESAGGNSVVNHLAQRASFPLYQRAVIESGTYFGARDLPFAETEFAALGAALNCSARGPLAACARAAGAEAVEAAAAAINVSVMRPGHGPASTAFTAGPVIDNVSLTAAPYQIFAAGEHNTKVPVVLGSNRDEMAMWFRATPGNMTESDFDHYAQVDPKGPLVADPKDFAELKRLYAASEYPYPSDLGANSQWWWAAMRVATDSSSGLGACSVRRAARDLAAAGNPAVWTYLFAHPDAGSSVVPHAAEIKYVFVGIRAPDGDAALSRDMARYWIRFAEAADPNGAGAAAWPRFTAAGDATMRIDAAPAYGGTGIAPQTGLRRGVCDFWDARLP